jgi:deoxyribodipyrimidine photo-lyase
MNKPIAIHWFRRDLRLHDNHALYEALREHNAVQPIFIFDTDILDELQDKKDARVQFIYNQILHINKQLANDGATLWLFYGKPIDVFKRLVQEYTLLAVYTNHDYEPYALQRDTEIQAFLTSCNVSFKTCKDQVIFERNDVVKSDGKPYTVFTPYSKAWKKKLQQQAIVPFPSEKLKDNLHRTDVQYSLSLESMGFGISSIPIPGAKADLQLIANYHTTRDIPSQSGTSRLGIHLRFGTISVRELVHQVRSVNETYLNELIWREFYMMILWHFPYVVSCSFKPAYDRIPWRNNAEEFTAWCTGTTGVPIVDAGMRELNETGFMHNRVRMITASFLIKDLLIDWRWGEAYFASRLLDFELSSNNGGWQWASSGGCDAAPYFRVFNPELQTKKFDPQYQYIKKWIPEWGTSEYPKPIVDHAFAKERVLQAYRNALR